MNTITPCMIKKIVTVYVCSEEGGEHDACVPDPLHRHPGHADVTAIV